MGSLFLLKKNVMIRIKFQETDVQVRVQLRIYGCAQLSEMALANALSLVGMECMKVLKENHAMMGIQCQEMDVHRLVQLSLASVVGHLLHLATQFVEMD